MLRLPKRVRFGFLGCVKTCRQNIQTEKKTSRTFVRSIMLCFLVSFYSRVSLMSRSGSLNARELVYARLKSYPAVHDLLEKPIFMGGAEIKIS